MLKLGRERRKENLPNKTRHKEVVEEIEDESKTEHKVKSRGIIKKPRRKQKIIIGSSSEDKSSSTRSEDETIVKRISRRSKDKPRKEEPTCRKPEPVPTQEPIPQAATKVAKMAR